MKNTLKHNASLTYDFAEIDKVMPILEILGSGSQYLGTNDLRSSQKTISVIVN